MKPCMIKVNAFITKRIKRLYREQCVCVAIHIDYNVLEAAEMTGLDLDRLQCSIYAPHKHSSQ